MSFDPKHGIFGGPSWRVNHLLRAREHLANERAEVKKAERRAQAAQAQVTLAFRELCEIIPAGSGAEAVNFVPWSVVDRSEDPDDPHAWTCRAGVSLTGAIRELVEIARISGYAEMIHDFNGVPVLASPGDTFETVCDRVDKARENLRK